MNRISFLVAKFAGDEEKISRFSKDLSDVSDDLRGKKVAVVGNARSLSLSSQGSEIDSADIVIRINSAPVPSPLSHGARTDWIAISVPVDPQRLSLLSPSRILWMTPKIRRLPWNVAQHPGFFLNPKSHHLELHRKTRSRPTTGLMVLDLLRRTDLAAVQIHGFDFFASLSLSGSRTAAQVAHDFTAEKHWVDELLNSDARFSLRPVSELQVPHSHME